jgi:hypothetical protein
MNKKPPAIKQKAIELMIISNRPWTSAEEILKDLQAIFKEELAQGIFKDEDLPTTRTLCRWRKAIEADKANRISRQLDQKSAEEHRAYLLAIVDMLLDGDVKHVIVVNKGDSIEESFGISSPESGYYEVPRNKIVGKIEANIDAICEHEPFSSWDMFDCFVPHLMAEYPPEQDYYELLNKYPGKLINTLKILVQRKKFKGTCPVCKEWQ